MKSKQDITMSGKEIFLLMTTKMMPRQKYYVVFEGRERGIYDSWERCQPLVYRYKGVVFKSFDSLEDAENHMYEYVQQKYGVQVSRPPLIEDVTAKQDIEDTKCATRIILAIDQSNMLNLSQEKRGS
ncbi:Ribonuclease H [Nymphaea thermarum]|nr:Ribonuclease H [Nymphaea thermarum]